MDPKRALVIAKISDELYKQTQLKEEKEWENIPNPTLWLFNQEKMRQAWLDMKDEVSKDHPLTRYMKFMYEQFPENFLKTMQGMISDSNQKPIPPSP